MAKRGSVAASGLAEDVADGGPLFVAAAGDGDPAVFGARRSGVVGAAEGAVGGGDGAAVAGAGLDDAVGGVVEDSGGEGVHDGLDLGHLHELAFTGYVAVAEGGEQGVGEVAGVDDVVGVVRADADGWVVGEARELANAGDGGQHGAETEEVAVGSDHALHGRVAGDDAGIGGHDVLGEEVPLLQHARREVGHEDVGALDQAVGDLLAALAVEVEQEAELARVEVVEVAGGVVGVAHLRAVLVEGDGLDDAERVDAGLGLDAHDLGAEGGERLAGDGAGAEPGEVGDAHALEGEGGAAGGGDRPGRGRVPGGAGVLAEAGRGRHGRGGGGEAVGRAGELDLAGIDGDGLVPVASAQLRVLRQVLGGRYEADEEAPALALLVRFQRGHGREEGGEDLVDVCHLADDAGSGGGVGKGLGEEPQVHAVHELHVGLVVEVVLKSGLVHPGDNLGEVGAAGGGDVGHHVSGLRRIDTDAGDGHAEEAEGTGAHAVGALEVPHHHGRLLGQGEGLLHGDVDVLALAGALGVVEGGERSLGGLDARADVALVAVDEVGWVLGLASKRHHATHRLSDDVAVGEAGVGAGLAEAGNRRVDEVGALAAEVVVAEAMGGKGAGHAVLKDDVGAEGELAGASAIRFPIEIEDEGALRAVLGPKGDARIGSGVAVEEGRGTALEAASGGLDLDDVGAEVGEQLAAVGADLVGEFEDAKVRERAVGHGYFPTPAVTVAGSRSVRISTVSPMICSKMTEAGRTSSSMPAI